MAAGRDGLPHANRSAAFRIPPGGDQSGVAGIENSSQEASESPDSGAVGSASKWPAGRRVESGSDKTMLHDVKELHDFTVGATDGEIGEVKDVYFDDERWVLRYMVVEAGGWLRGRKVLISPISVRDIAWEDGVINVNLSQQQVRESPSIDTDKPVSRQHEIDYYNHYGYPNYWNGAELWGLGVYPLPWVGASPDAAVSSRPSSEDSVTRERQQSLERDVESADSHLRSCKEVIGYEVMATDGPIGTVENFVFEDTSWAIRSMVVDTRKWLPGKHVLVSPEWIESVSWSEHEVYVKVARQAVEASPAYDPSRPLSTEHEAPLD
ncbi:MAG TPA: PRC-barrel domain-containing protein [Sphingomicrobium sp.]